LSASQKWKQYEERFCASCVPPLNPKLNSRTWQDADFIEKSILAEFQRREPSKKKADDENAEKQKLKPPKPNNRVMALYLHYCNPPNRGSKKAIKEYGKKLGCKSPDSFYNYAWRSAKNLDYRINPEHIEDLRSAIKMLEAENKDTTAAIHDLNTAEGRAKRK
jgi:hypothetical protein